MPGPIEVTDTDTLIAALRPANAGRRIRVHKEGTYRVKVPLLVPDGASLEGEGVMLGHNLPTGWKQDTETRITALPALKGDLITLGDGSSVQKLVLEQRLVLEDPADRVGNVVAVASRSPGDSVSAEIEECELINPNESGGGPDGPVGGALIAYTRNPNAGAAPPAHEDATVTAWMRRSLVRAPGGGRAVFAMNFASRGKVTVGLGENVLGGSVDAVGGLSRPDAVVDATTTINSHGNLYSQPGSDLPAAWQIVGGSSGPPPFAEAGASSNLAHADSTDDLIQEDFQFGIAAFGGRRLPGGGPSSHNKVELELINLTLRTAGGPDAADFQLAGALSLGFFSAGDENSVAVLVRNTMGSGRRENFYAPSAGFGTGNRLIFHGTPVAFNQSNRDIDPGPAAEFFEHGS
jgi:hypothetical protein